MMMMMMMMIKIFIIIMNITGDSGETAYLFRQLSVALQKANAISFQNTLTAG